MIGRVWIPGAACVVRVDLENDGIRAWLAERWIAGETQKKIALSLGLKTKSPICSLLAHFLIKYCPETKSPYDFDRSAYGGHGRPVPGRDDRKRALREAVRRFRAVRALPHIMNMMATNND